MEKKKRQNKNNLFSANVSVPLTAVPSTTDTHTFTNFELGAEWGIVNGTYSSCNVPHDFQSLDTCVSGNTDTTPHILEQPYDYVM